MANDEGIKQLDKTTWAIRVKRLEKRTGMVINRKATITGTKADARKARDAIRAELASTHLSRPRTRLKDYAVSWLERRGNAGLKRSVVRKYGYGLKHIIPAIGNIYLDSISPEDVGGYIAARTAEAGIKGGNTVLNELRLLRTIAKDSVAEGYATKDWCARVKAPPVKVYTRAWANMLSAPEFTKLVNVIPPQWRGLVLFMATTGLRWGEASALHWEDVDLAAGEAVIQKGNDRGRITTVKTKGSNRIVPVLPDVAALWGKPKARGLVFPTRDGKLHKGTPLKKVLDKACPKAGVPRVTAHGLRRTFNNLARKSSSLLVLQSITGHSTDAMTSHYSMVSTDEKTVVSRSVAESIGVPKVSPSDDAESGSAEKPE